MSNSPRAGTAKYYRLVITRIALEGCGDPLAYSRARNWHTDEADFLLFRIMIGLRSVAKPTSTIGAPTTMYGRARPKQVFALAGHMGLNWLGRILLSGRGRWEIGKGEAADLT